LGQGQGQRIVVGHTSITLHRLVGNLRSNGRQSCYTVVARH